MALSPIDANCPRCSTRFAAAPTRTFLGFQKMPCPNCKANVVYPLTRGYRITYWALFAVMLLSIAGALSKGEIGAPGGIGIAVTIALIRDASIMSRVKKLEANGHGEQAKAPAGG